MVDKLFFGILPCSFTEYKWRVRVKTSHFSAQQIYVKLKIKIAEEADHGNF